MTTFEIVEFDPDFIYTYGWSYISTDNCPFEADLQLTANIHSNGKSFYNKEITLADVKGICNAEEKEGTINLDENSQAKIEATDKQLNQLIGGEKFVPHLLEALKEYAESSQLKFELFPDFSDEDYNPLAGPLGLYPEDID